MAFSFLKLTRHHGEKKNHEKLGEGWGENREPVKEGVTFYVKYLGSTLVEELTDTGHSYGEGISAVAVAAVVSMAKSLGKKLHKVALKTSPRGIIIQDFSSDDIMMDISIDRIRFCTADSHHEKVFAFIARNTDNETMECHAFLCSKKKMAQAVTLSVAQAFNIAYDEWKDEEKMEQESNLNHRKSVKKPIQQFNFSTTQSHNSVGYTAVPALFTPERATPSLLDVLEPRDLPQTTTPHRRAEHSHHLPFPALRKPVAANHSNGHSRPEHKSDLRQSRENWVSFDDDEGNSQRVDQKEHFTFGTNLRSDEIDDGVRSFIFGSSREEFTRQKSIEDLLNL